MQRVFVDANVLFSRTLRDWLCLLRLETGSMFQVHTTEDVLAETAYRLRRTFPHLPGHAVPVLRSRIVGVFDEILSDYDSTVSFSGDDPDDRHVHAAAVSSGADILLTADTGFDADGVGEAGYEVQTCDEFFVLVDDSAKRDVERVTAAQLTYWLGRPAEKRKPLAQALKDAGCPEFAKRVDLHIRTLAGPLRGHDSDEPTLVFGSAPA